MILIDMETPGGCADCRFCDVFDDFRCTAMEPDREDAYMDLYVLEAEESPKPDDCPIISTKELYDISDQVVYKPV